MSGTSTHEKLKPGEGRWIPILLPITAALGPHLVPIEIGPGSFYGFRFLVILMAVLTAWKLFAAPDHPFRFGRIQTQFFWMMGIWIVWGLLSCTWAPDLEPALKEVACLVFGGVLVIGFSILLPASMNTVERLHWGWVLGMVATGSVAVWELVTGRHLVGYWVTNSGLSDRISICVSTFDNPNNYAAFILLSSPMLFWAILSSRSRWAKVMIWTLAALEMALLVCTGSRLAVAGEIVMVVVFFALMGRGLKRWFYLLGTIAVILCALPMVQQDQNLSIMYKLENMGSVLADSSGIERLHLQWNGLWMISKTHGLGVGAAGFGAVMKSGAIPYPNGIYSPHDFAIEIASQYGLLVFSFVVIWFGKLVSRVFRAWKFAIREKSHMARALWATYLAGFVGFLFAIFCNSGFLVQPITWCLFLTWVYIGTLAEQNVKLIQSQSEIDISLQTSARQPQRSRPQ